MTCVCVFSLRCVDQVAFGEVVHHPPDITAHVRKADSSKLSKVRGGRDRLAMVKFKGALHLVFFFVVV